MALITNLISYYKCNENAANTTVADSEGTNTGTSSVNTSVMTSAGKVSGEGAFDYANSRDVNFGDVAAFDGGHLAINLWCKTGSVDNNDVIITKRTGGVGWVMQDNGSGKFKFQYEVGGSEVDLISTTSISTSDVWQMVTFTYDGTTGRLYIDGTEEATSTAVSGNLDSNAGACRLGEHSSAGIDNWNGEIGSVGIWSEEVPSGDVTSLYNSGSGFAYPFTNDVIISPSAFTLSTSEQAPSLFIDISQSAVFALTAGLPVPMLDVPEENPNKGTVSTKEISKLTIPEGIGDVQNLIPQGINGLKTTVLIKNIVGLEL